MMQVIDKTGAGEGNRTLVFSLEGVRSPSSYRWFSDKEQLKPPIVPESKSGFVRTLASDRERPPDRPQMRSPAVREDDRAKSQVGFLQQLNNTPSNPGLQEMQARCLVEMFALPAATASTVAELAFGFARVAQ